MSWASCLTAPANTEARGGIVLLAASGLMAVAWIFLRCTLVYPPSDTGTTSKLTPQIYAKSFTDFIRQPRGWLITIYLFLAPFGEGLLAGMKTPFYIDPLEDGGLGMGLKAIGVMAPVSTTIMILTGIAGGLIVRKFGLRRCLFPLGFLMFVPNMGIALLPLFQQQASVSHEFLLFGRMEIAIFPWDWIANFIEIAGYGIAFAAYLTFTAFLIKTGDITKPPSPPSSAQSPWSATRAGVELAESSRNLSAISGLLHSASWCPFPHGCSF